MNCPSCGFGYAAGAFACPGCGKVLEVLSEGQIVASRYEILGLLGKGGMGSVYRAHDRVLEEVVALKVLRPDGAGEPDIARRFRSEIKLARLVRHPNVCSIHDYGEANGLTYISMEFVDGLTLKDLVARSGRLSTAEALEVCGQIVEGLSAIHGHGIVHRDVKTPNIMRDSAGLIRLMDFGVAKRIDSRTSVTATGLVIGTPEYMSPEQARGERIDHRTDIYALGIVVFELFTGRVPFRGDTPIATILMHLEQPAPLTGPLAECLPEPVREALRSALAKSATDRFDSVRDFGSALQGRAPAKRAVETRPRWTLQNRPPRGRAKPATTGVATETG